MVEYVVRCGPAFEAAIRRRSEERFSFLEPSHPHHEYYRRRLSSGIKAPCPPPTEATMAAAPPPPLPPSAAPAQAIPPPPPEEGDASQDSSEKSLGDKDEEVGAEGNRTKPTPVCFSIKKPKVIIIFVHFMFFFF
jgi:hypothetical protein